MNYLPRVSSNFNLPDLSLPGCWITGVSHQYLTATSAQLVFVLMRQLLVGSEMGACQDKS
jgi:hypothetical protein